MLQQEMVTFFIGRPAPIVASSTADARIEDFHPNFPYVEVVNFKGGPSAVIRGTRFNVCHIIGYLLMGETPETLAQEFPLTVAQIHDAQRYYAYHKDEIDEERRENTEEAAKKKLLELLGEENYRKVTGG